MLGRLRPSLWVIVAACLFGASTPASKLLLGSMGPLRLAGLLYLGAAITVAPWALRGGAAKSRWRPRNLARLAGVVVFGGVVGPIALLLGLARAPASSVALWLSLETVFTAVFAALFFREHVGVRGWIAVVVITAASVAIASPSGLEGGVAALLVATACACWGLDNNLTAVIDGFTPAQSTFAKGIAAGATNLALSFALERASFELSSTLGALAIGALAYGASLVLYVAGAQQLGASRSQMIFSSAPFFGAALAWALLGDALTLVHVLARSRWRPRSSSCTAIDTRTSTTTAPSCIRTGTATTTGTTITSTRGLRHRSVTRTSTRTRRSRTRTPTSRTSTIVTRTLPRDDRMLRP